MARILYRIAAVLIVLFDLGHSLGCPWSDPAWRVDLGSVQSAVITVVLAAAAWQAARAAKPSA